MRNKFSGTSRTIGESDIVDNSTVQEVNDLRALSQTFIADESQTIARLNTYSFCYFTFLVVYVYRS